MKRTVKWKQEKRQMWSTPPVDPEKAFVFEARELWQIEVGLVPVWRIGGNRW